MAHQPEAILENDLITLLRELSYSYASILNEDDIHANMKSQLELFNSSTYSDKEFSSIIKHLSKGNIFQKSKILRDHFQLNRDNGDSSYVQFYDSENWSKNLFQVTNQVTQKGTYKNRYDVTILVNGPPLVQIELKEAFNQINRYQRHSLDFQILKMVLVYLVPSGLPRASRYLSIHYCLNSKMNYYQHQQRELNGRKY